MKGYVGNIEDAAKENENFRKVLYTGKNSQLVVMALKPQEEIGEEVHRILDPHVEDIGDILALVRDL